MLAVAIATDSALGVTRCGGGASFWRDLTPDIAVDLDASTRRGGGLHRPADGTL
jgi:hypothetical protein